ncbi:MAG: c-type cytochrome [Rhodospirillales bacterium]|nr:c-type cytochrome [Rhodospirillales bacterium]
MIDGSTLDTVARPAKAAGVLLLGLVIVHGAAAANGPDGAPRSSADAKLASELTAWPADFSRPEAYEGHAGGAGTSFHAPTRNAFSHPAQNLAPSQRTRFRVGDAIFRKLWVTAPASTAASDGLGPLFNARSCQRCHRKDGRGRPPLNEDDRGGTLLLALTHPDGADPVYGRQLQTNAVPGIPAEGEISITHRMTRVAGQRDLELRSPQYGALNLSWGPLDPQTGLSPRVAPPMIGLGLLEAIPEADILAHADPDDADDDGISGRPSWVAAEAGGALVLGRFGWKAAVPTVRMQAAKAFFEDIGIGNRLFPGSVGACTEVQAECRNAPGGDHNDDGIEIPARLFDQVVFYSRNLAVPARRDPDDPDILDGKRIFFDSGCADCHVPKFVTLRTADRPEHSFQLIWPYTDLLLHDMGEELADTGADPLRREWRTPPLWGIGLTETVSGTFRLLHDGRADGLMEAILWHGGEAAPSRDRVAQLSEEERERLLAFLRSL